MTETSPQDKGIHLLGRPLGLALLAFYKGIWGTLEVLAGVFILLSYRIATGELTEDPQDLFANWLFSHLGIAQAGQLGKVIVLLGAIKIVIAFGLWYRSWVIRNVALAFFGAAAVFGLYELSVSLTLFRLGALLMDLFLLWYFWLILPKHLHHGEVS